MTAALLFGKPGTEASFVPPPFDPAAQSGQPDVPAGLGYGEIDAKVFKVSICGKFSPSDGSADLWLTNHASNSVWLKLRVLDADGRILVETGLIRPGEYVRSVTLQNTPTSGTEIIFKLMAYEPDTYRSAGSVSLTTAVS